jgi:hypothetical protein
MRKQRTQRLVDVWLQAVRVGSVVSLRHALPQVWWQLWHGPAERTFGQSHDVCGKRVVLASWRSHSPDEMSCGSCVKGWLLESSNGLQPMNMIADVTRC